MSSKITHNPSKFNPLIEILKREHRLSITKITPRITLVKPRWAATIPLAHDKRMISPADVFQQFFSTDMPTLTHFDNQGQAHMVDVATKPATHRTAVASGRIEMRRETLRLIEAGTAMKGDVLGIARIAGIQGAKKTSDLIPLCHPLALTRIAIDFQTLQEDNLAAGIICNATVETIGQTGVEMEALTAVQIALLTIYDMCKAVDRGMLIRDVYVIKKHGGNSGSYTNYYPRTPGNIKPTDQQ